MTLPSHEPQYWYYSISAAALILGFLYKGASKVYKWLNKEWTELKTDREKLHIIFTEATCNHGSSIKDKVNTLAEEMKKNTDMTAQIFYRQRWIMENQKLPIFESDEHGMCVWVNEDYVRLFGKGENSFLGNGWKNFIHPEDRERVERQWDNAVHDKIDSVNSFRIIGSDGSVMYVKVIANRTDRGYIGSIVVDKR